MLLSSSCSLLHILLDPEGSSQRCPAPLRSHGSEESISLCCRPGAALCNSSTPLSFKKKIGRGVINVNEEAFLICRGWVEEKPMIATGWRMGQAAAFPGEKKRRRSFRPVRFRSVEHDVPENSASSWGDRALPDRSAIEENQPPSRGAHPHRFAGRSYITRPQSFSSLAPCRREAGSLAFSAFDPASRASLTFWRSVMGVKGF